MRIAFRYAVIMLLLQIFLALLFSAVALALPAVPAEISRGNLSRIIGGGPSLKSNYYEVAIVSDNDLSGIRVCTGALLNHKWIVTSAYCATRKTRLRIEYGTNTIFGDGNAGQMVHRKFIHPSYSPTNLLNDIAVLELNPSILGNMAINEVSLPSSSVDNYVGQTGTVSGWGASTDYGPYSISLQSRTVSLINTAYCQRDGHYMTPYKLCSEGRVVCEGDQGAPLVIGSTLVGIAAVATEALTCEGMRTVPYTRVSYYAGWIRQITGDTTNSCIGWNCIGK